VLLGWVGLWCFCYFLGFGLVGALCVYDLCTRERLTLSIKVYITYKRKECVLFGETTLG
jgi:hypothetical protein